MRQLGLGSQEFHEQQQDQLQLYCWFKQYSQRHRLDLHPVRSAHVRDRLQLHGKPGGTALSAKLLMAQVLLYGTLYHDAGSAYFHTHHNVVVGGPMWLYTQRPSLTGAYNITIDSIWTNQTNFQVVLTVLDTTADSVDRTTAST